MKIFGIGLHKTGTSTLRECLKTLGYNVCPEEYGYLITEQVANGDYRLAVMLARFFDGFQDSPWNYRGFYRALDAVFDARFILTVRDGTRWFESLLRWCAVYGVGNSLHMAATLGTEVTPHNRSEVIDLYHQAIEETKDYFSDKQDRLLVLDWETGDGWQKLCRFVGKSVPGVPLPHILKYDRDTATWSDYK